MKRSFMRRAVVAVAVLAVALLGFAVNQSRYSWEVSRQLSAAINDAQSVTFVEFGGNKGKLGAALVFQRVAATPQQVAALRAAIGQWYAPHPGRSLECYEPHHRVEVVRADGSILLLEVCFMCGNYGFATNVRAMPEVWRKPLRDVFADAGMPPRPRTDYEAMAINHPDYDRLVQERNEIQSRQPGGAVKAGKPESQSYSKEMLEYMRSREAVK